MGLVTEKLKIKWSTTSRQHYIDLGYNFTKIGYLFARKGIKEMKAVMDYKKYGGAMLLGVNGADVKAHGNSDEKSFYAAIKYADLMIQNEVVNKIKEEFKNEENN